MAVPGHALGLLVPASFLALVPIQLARDGRNRSADPGGNVRFRLALFLQRLLLLRRGLPHDLRERDAPRTFRAWVGQ